MEKKFVKHSATLKHNTKYTSYYIVLDKTSTNHKQKPTMLSRDISHNYPIHYANADHFPYASGAKA